MATVRTSDYSRAFSRLCHLAALSRSGKTAAAIDGLVISTLAIDPDSCATLRGLGDAISTYFGLRLPESTLRASHDRLVEAGRLRTSEDEPGQYVLSDVERKSFDERARTAKEVRDRLREEWVGRTVTRPGLGKVDPGVLWRCLESYTTAAFQRHGIRAVELLCDGAVAIDSSHSLGALLSDAIRDAGLAPIEGELTAAVREFFANATTEKTSYLAHLLDATFTYYAIAVDEASTQYLRDTLSPLRVFVDTNVLFGVLGLSDDYFSGVSQQLVSLVREHRLPFTLHFHERTLREFRYTVDAVAADLRRSQWSQDLSRAAVRYGEATGAMRSIELAYHRQNAETRTSPDVFFSKYDHAERLLTATGLRLYRDDPDDGEVAVRTKGLRVAEYEAFVKRERPDRPRPYEALDHDVVVWTTVQKQRSVGGSALDSGAIFLTNDYLFERFERRYLRPRDSSASVVIAAHFLQVLRPFVPTTSDFDRQLVENLTLPEFQVAHSDYRRVGENVLSYMATYSDLTEETALAVLGDEILRNQIRQGHGDVDLEPLVDSAIVRENGRLQDERRSLETALEAKSRAMDAAASKSDEVVAALKASLTEQAARIESLERASPQQLDASAEELSRLTRERDAAVSSLVSMRARIKWLALIVVAIAWLTTVWAGPTIAPNLPLMTDLGHHSRRLAIQVSLSTALLFMFAAAADKERRPIWLGALAVLEPVAVSFASLL